MQTDPTGPSDGAPPEVLALAKVVARLRAEVAELEGLLSTAAVLERAKGLLMAREGLSADAAYEALIRRAGLHGRTLLEECWITLGGIRSRATPSPPTPLAVTVCAGPAADGDGSGDGDGSVFSSGRYLTSGRGGAGSRALLASLAASLAAARSADDAARFLHETLRVPLGVDGVMIYVLDEAGRLELTGHAGIDDVLAAQWRDIPPFPGVAALEVITSREPRWLEDPERDVESYQVIGPPERWPTRAWIPVLGNGSVTSAIGFFRILPAPFGDADRALLQQAVRLCGGPLRVLQPRETGPVDEEVAAVQRILDALTGPAILLSPLRSPAGEVEDYRIDAAAPDSVDVAGRRGKELVGRRILETYPTVAGTPVWQGYLDALDTGTTYEGEPFSYQEVAAGVRETSVYSVRATRLAGRLVVSWVRHDTSEREIRRLATMQRLGNLGWADWNLTTDTINWSEQLYAIFDRPPDLGPMTLEELPNHLVADDLPTLAEAVQRLLGEGVPIDQPFRITTEGGVRHLRIVAEAETDANGVPVEVHGFFQDLTPQRDTELALRESERAVLVQRGMLQAERAIAARLQHALLPIPEQSIELVGLRVDIAYMPSDSGVNVGGDWYSAIELPDKSAFFVVGDVAGHGLDAVGTMAQLRFTAKGMIITGSALPDAMGRLNTLLLHTAATTATMIMARYWPAERRLAWVRAGHLPPLLIRGGEARYLPLPEGSLLGASFDSVYVQETLDLEPGDHLLLYTDGLIEVPGESIDKGLDRLVEAAALAMGGGTPEPLAQLLSALQPAGRDDVCVLDIHVPRGTCD
ncbi:SpoIIE family protein phosphatase [Streptomyces sp. ISL-86]|uniref:SpoIIE family protein phosphatase n=1 Tax=Streptomyces sp. ISL-86 TaxID=2819187 RepID=UPI001BE80923|nr:SpoIIE family protein phosphatase [Streptomyces sp. ISL-86]MBT2459091.1 SpoIIE family protein phosphatase [Streptomyces sp. ISL-86]